jgi:predicted GNAT family N-acyltransferase
MSRQAASLPEDSPVNVAWARDSSELAQAFELRIEVFCDEQGVPREEELDHRDEEALHVVALAGDRVVGTLRVLVDGARAKIGRVAVARDYRRRGIAHRMMLLGLDGAREAGCSEAALTAQTYAIALYEKSGFSVDSDVFEEAGMPHVWMVRAL